MKPDISLLVIIVAAIAVAAVALVPNPAAPLQGEQAPELWAARE